MSDDVPESTLGERIIEAFVEGHKKRKRLEEHEEQRFPHDVMNRINESMPAMLEGASNGCTRFEVKFQDKYKYFRPTARHFEEVMPADIKKMRIEDAQAGQQVCNASRYTFEVREVNERENVETSTGFHPGRFVRTFVMELELNRSYLSERIWKETGCTSFRQDPFLMQQQDPFDEAAHFDAFDSTAAQGVFSPSPTRRS